MKRERILGIPFDAVSTRDALKMTEGFLADDKTHVIVHLSLPMLMIARRDKFLRIFLEEADLVIPSGRYIYWAARLLQRTIIETIDPSRFTKLLMSQSIELNKSIYLFGGKSRTIDRAYDNLKKEMPKLFIVGRYRGDYPKQEHEWIVQAIGKASPDYFFIGTGSPLEEKWVERNREKLNTRIIVLIGGLFDIFAGSLKKHYRKYSGPESTESREIPHPRSFRKLWWIPLFIVLVCFERLFWKH